MDEQRRARVVAVHKNRWQLALESEGSQVEVSAVLSGRFRHEADGPAGLPVVGDWVTAVWTGGGNARILAIEPRTGLLARKRPGDTAHDAVVEQAIAANVDVGLVAMGVDNDFNVHRLERYLTVVWDCGATPVVVLTKSDLATPADLGDRTADVEAIAFGTRTIVTSARTGEGVAHLRSALVPGTCAVLLGSSGVGKSSLLNALAGADLQDVTAVRQFDGKGRHTTTSRRLVELPWGAYLVDTPGLRELQLWGDAESLTASFSDVEDLAAECRFTDCVHDAEPGCAVRAAVAEGSLAPARLESWRRLRRELAHVARRRDAGAARAERQRWKSIAKQRRQHNRERRS